MDVIFCLEIDSKDEIEDDCLLAFAAADPSEVVGILEEELDNEGNTAKLEDVLEELEDRNGVNAEVACMMEVVDEEELDEEELEDVLVADNICLVEEEDILEGCGL